MTTTMSNPTRHLFFSIFETMLGMARAVSPLHSSLWELMSSSADRRAQILSSHMSSSSFSDNGTVFFSMQSFSPRLVIQNQDDSSG